MTARVGCVAVMAASIRCDLQSVPVARRPPPGHGSARAGQTRLCGYRKTFVIFHRCKTAPFGCARSLWVLPLGAPFGCQWHRRGIADGLAPVLAPTGTLSAAPFRPPFGCQWYRRGIADGLAPTGTVSAGGLAPGSRPLAPFRAPFRGCQVSGNPDTCCRLFGCSIWVLFGCQWHRRRHRREGSHPLAPFLQCVAFSLPLPGARHIGQVEGTGAGSHDGARS